MVIIDNPFALAFWVEETGNFDRDGGDFKSLEQAKESASIDGDPYAIYEWQPILETYYQVWIHPSCDEY